MESTTITRQVVKAAVDKCEAELRWCLSFMHDFRIGKGDPSAFFKFQGELAKTIFRMSRLYHEIADARNLLIERKAKLTPKSFRDHQRRLAGYQKVIRAVLATARGIGDGFAWFFYRNERQLLRRHLSNQFQLIGPRGTGALGELELAAQLPILNGLLVLHHSVTSILRLGDVSLIDVHNWQVAGVGELKTEKTGPGSINAQLQLIIKTEFLKEPPEGATIATKAPVFKPKVHDQLKRQFKNLSELVKPEAYSGSHSGMGANNVEKFAQAFRQMRRDGSMSYVQLDDGFVAGLLWDRRRTLWSRLTTQTKLPDMDGVSEIVKRTIVKGSLHNSVHIGRLYYASDDSLISLPEGAPLFFWGLPDSCVDAIIMRQLDVVTIFNPAPIVDKFKAIGLTPRNSGGRLPAEYQFARDGKQGVFGNAQTFYSMVIEYLVTEESVVRTIDIFLQHTKQRGAHRTQIDFGYYPFPDPEA